MRALKPREGKGPKAIEEALARYDPTGDAETKHSDPPAPGQPICSLDDYIVLSNIECVDANGNVFERYPTLHVAKDIFRDAQGRQINITPYDHTVHSEQNGMFLPSFALTCNIVAALYANRTDTEVNKVLRQYKDKGNGNGWHAQNTVINYGTEEVIHNPTASDFGKQQPVNSGQARSPLHFDKATLHDAPLKDVLRDQAHRRFVRQLTGLRNPSILVDIGEYFGKPAKLWFPWPGQSGSTYSEKRAAWFGCYGNNLLLDGGMHFLDAGELAFPVPHLREGSRLEERPHPRDELGFVYGLHNEVVRA